MAHSLFITLWFQITSACSDRDNEWWKRNFAAVFDSGKTIQHLSVKDSRILTEKQVHKKDGNIFFFLNALAYREPIKDKKMPQIAISSYNI